MRTEPLDLAGDLMVVMEGRAHPAADLPARGIPPPWLVEEALRQTGIAEKDGGPEASVVDRLRALALSGATRALALAWLTQVWGGDPRLLSPTGMTGVKRGWRSGGGEWRVVDGYDGLATFLADGLDVRLGQTVHQVSWRPRHVEVVTGAGVLRSRAVVVTVPPPVAADAIRFEPGLPSGKRAAAERLPLGGSAVVVYRLKSPSPSSVWALVLDGCGGFWRATKGASTLVAWSKGPRATEAAQTPGDLTLARSVAAALWPGSAPEVAGVAHVADWTTDPLARGGFTYPAVGSLGASVAWAEPVGATLFFAGEATCGDTHPATVHGALESGWRAADQVAAALAS